jgi:acetamidase/formamidase
MGSHQLAPTPETVHWGYFDAAIPSRITIDSGDTITLNTVSGGAAEIPDWATPQPGHREIIEKLKPVFGPHILTGPVSVRGAMPGDTLEIAIKSIELTVDWGWNVIRPLRGTLPEDFPNFARRLIPIDRKAMTTTLPWGQVLPLAPFFGILAVSPPAHYGAVSTVEPREYGGNIDCKELIAGSSLFIPVQVPGANFSAGDGHGVQGDGEVCLTALETSLRGTFTLTVHKGMALAMPRAITPTHHITFGMDVDLDDAAKQALRDMIAWLVTSRGWTKEEAYVFCSLACDLHVTQLVDGNKGVHAMVLNQYFHDLK